ncbi:hypothetical protein R5R35_008924 [Gryllus longicercus]|uniref:Cuticular protein n=1 Tax=Gryllus longicercus TaxID=2509291 RepID=A0AAN9VLQ7_9ORTH
MLMKLYGGCTQLFAFSLSHVPLYSGSNALRVCDLNGPRVHIRDSGLPASVAEEAGWTWRQNKGRPGRGPAFARMRPGKAQSLPSLSASSLSLRSLRGSATSRHRSSCSTIAMKTLLACLACGALVWALGAAAPQGPGPFPPRPPGPPGSPFAPRPLGPAGPPPPFVPIVQQNFDLNGVDGSYTFGYEGADGNTRQESGVVNNPGTPVEAMAVTGSYSYVGADGVPVVVNYIADENGFQPIGDSVHPAIQRAVAEQVAFARGNPPPPPPGPFFGGAGGPPARPGAPFGPGPFPPRP